MSDVDVVVAGAGAAGISSALAATQSGASVLLLDRNRDFATQSNTALSTAMIPAGGSRWQQEAGIRDSPEQFRADVDAKTKGSADPLVADSLVAVAPELVAWLHDDCGVPLGLVTDFNYPGHSVPRCHAVADRSGRTMLAHLLAAAESTSAILMAPAELTQATPTATGWSCAIGTPDGGGETVQADSLILATNGYGARPDLVAQYLPEMSAALYFGSPGSIGTAVDLGLELGADLADLDAYQGHGSVAVPHGVLTTWATVMHGAILVNSRGDRFGDETTGYSEYARLVLDQPEATAWVILDEAIDALCRPFADYQALLEQHALRWAASAEELSGLIGIEPAGLTATLEGLSPRSGRPDPLGRTFWERELTPPLAAIRVTGALFHTQGGLRVDNQARVLRNGQPIPGLYAAGGAAVGMSGTGPTGYLAGNGLLAALGLGLLAGRSAAERSAAISAAPASGGRP